MGFQRSRMDGLEEQGGATHYVTVGQRSHPVVGQLEVAVAGMPVCTPSGKHTTCESDTPDVPGYVRWAETAKRPARRLRH